METKITTEHLFNMKKTLSILIILLSIISCNGQQNTGFFGSYQGDVITVPSGVFTSLPVSITTNSAVLGGSIQNGDGNLPIIRNGVCWNTTGALDDLGSDYYNMPVCHIIPGVTCYFSMNVGYLSPNTLYYIQAYAENANGINFGSQGTFTTLSAVSIPAVSTNLITSITSTTATGGGIVINEGSSSVTIRGICWGTSINPTTAKPLIPTTSGGRTKNGSGIGEFTSSITGASANTLYYVRAYATNTAGTAYGENQTFTTLGSLPTLTTASTSLITISSATSGGEVLTQGSSSVTQRGICYSTSINPDTSQPTTTTATGGKILSGIGLGTFSCDMSGLNAGTLYYVRAYAINSSGTSYGVNQSFTTTSIIVATLSSSLNSESEDLVLVNWNLSLSSPTVSSEIIPIIATNGSGSGTSTFSFYLSAGQQTATQTIPYSKLSSSYTAYANFGTMPPGYTGTNTASYLIPAILTCPSIGDSYQGGIVAYLFQLGDQGYVSGQCHGIIIAPNDLSLQYSWGCDGVNVPNTTVLGWAEPTTAAMTGCTDGDNAGKACYNYSLSGYDDWLLPTQGDLLEIYDSKIYLFGEAISTPWNFSIDAYWTSSQSDTTNAYTVSFLNRFTYGFPKVNTYSVRAIRYF